MDASIRVAEQPAARGAFWLADAFRLFRASPLQWIGLCAGWISITFALVLVPFLGGVIANFLQPAFFASFAVAAYKQSAGERIVMADLFGGFRRNMRALVNLGAIELLAAIGIVALMTALGLPSMPDSSPETAVSDYLELLKGHEWVLALGFVLLVILKGALWFAPPLIAFHGMSTGHAIRWSLYAALANIGAMIVYGAALLGLMLLSVLTSGLGLVVAMPMMVISTYIGYREVFEAKVEATAQ